jgi:hypothetical protein
MIFIKTSKQGKWSANKFKKQLILSAEQLHIKSQCIQGGRILQNIGGKTQEVFLSEPSNNRK